MSHEHQRADNAPVGTSAAWERGEGEYAPSWTSNDDAVLLPSGQPDFDARNVLPKDVMDLYALHLDDRSRDQCGVLWKDTERSRSNIVHSVRTMAAAVLANPKEVEKNLWQALVESGQHPLIAFTTMQRGQHKNPAMRVAETREYFEGVIKYPLGMFHARMRELVQMVNARHAAYGVRDGQAERIHPHMQRAFKYVTLLFVARFKDAVAKGGRMAAALGGAVEDLYNRADVWLGMLQAPVDMDHFLETEDRLIDEGDRLLRQSHPALFAGLRRASHRIAANSLEATSKRQGLSEEALAQTLREKTRERLSM